MDDHLVEPEGTELEKESICVCIWRLTFEMVTGAQERKHNK
jgi:hypothetical protein